jgi:hypothetical protein
MKGIIWTTLKGGIRRDFRIGPKPKQCSEVFPKLDGLYRGKDKGLRGEST